MKVFGKPFWLILIIVVVGGIIAMYGKTMIDQTLRKSSPDSTSH